MGCSSIDSKYYENFKKLKFRLSLEISDDKVIAKVGTKSSEKNFDILMHIAEENDIVAPLMKKKIDEYCLKRNTSDPVIIGTGKCGNPCYEYNLDLLFKCPKCGGKVNKEVENKYELEEVYNDRTGRYEKQKNYKEKGICIRFNFNENIDKIDVNLDEFIKYFEKVDNEKIVHWSAEIYGQNGLAPVEKDMPIHYMMLDGERYEFPYGIHMKEFFNMNQELFFPMQNDMLLFSQAYGGKHTIPSRGEICLMFYDNQPEMGQSCGSYGFSWFHTVYIYECDECNYRYHVIKTSPFNHRDKSKDPK